MTADEACLHNPDPVPRTCTVLRPDLPPGAHLEAGDGRGGGSVRVTIRTAGDQS